MLRVIKMPKITIIEAGSLIFSRQLIWDILSFPQLSDGRISLMDIDRERLNLIAHLAQKVVEDKGWGAKIESTLDRRKALEGAAYGIVKKVLKNNKDASMP